MGFPRKTKTTKKRKSLNKTRRRKKGGTTSTTTSFKTLNCAPSKSKGKSKLPTCYDESQLKFIRAIWNAKHPDDKIPKSASLKQVWTTVKEKFKNKCNDESCWIDELVKGSGQGKASVSKNLDKAFAPDAPKEWETKPNMWLDNLNISDVMKQYEDAYKCFDFIGPSPIDFDTRTKTAGVKVDDDCVWEELCKFSVKKMLAAKKTKIGIIFNTDPHDKPGQHWISMFVNLKKGKIFFFDSVGSAAPKEVMVLVNRIISQGKKQNPPIHFKFDQNHPVEHQYSDTECGMYSLYFIIHMLEDKMTAQYLKTHIITDNLMTEQRKILFN